MTDRSALVRQMGRYAQSNEFKSNHALDSMRGIVGMKIIYSQASHGGDRDGELPSGSAYLD